MLKEQLKSLQLDYVDLYLVHGPGGVKKSLDGNPFPVENGVVAYDVVDHMETWGQMEEAFKLGLAKHIGISNYGVSQIQKLYDAAAIKPHNLQCELSVYWPQNELYKLCNRLSITMTGYGSIGGMPDSERHAIFKFDKPQPILSKDPTVVRIAEKYRKSPTQILLRWVIQRGICVIPKSCNQQRQKENFDILDFQLDDKDFEVLSNLPIRQHAYNPNLYNGHPQKPAADDPS